MRTLCSIRIFLLSGVVASGAVLLPYACAQSILLNPVAELSRVPGVSITRIEIVSADPALNESLEKGWDMSVQYPFFSKSFASVGRLSYALKSAARIRSELIFGGSLLPPGTYTIKVDTSNSGFDQDKAMEEVQAKLFTAFEKSFGVRMSRQKRKMQVLVLSKGETWKRDGFKAYSWPFGSSGRAATDGTWDFAGYDMDEIAGKIEGEVGTIVLNETGISGRFQGNMLAGSMATTLEGPIVKLKDVQEDVRKHGLLLREAMRDMDVVVIEKNR